MYNNTHKMFYFESTYLCKIILHILQCYMNLFFMHILRFEVNYMYAKFKY